MYVNVGDFYVKEKGKRDTSTNKSKYLKEKNKESIGYQKTLANIHL